MAPTNRLRYNGLLMGQNLPTLGALLTVAGSTMTLTASLNYQGGTAVPTVADPNFVALVIEPGTQNEEVVWLTAYTSGALSGTILRGQEGTTAVAHASGVIIVHGPTVSEFNSPQASGDVTARQGVATQVAVGAVGPSSASGVTFQNGEAGSNLYRQTVGALRSDGSISATALIATGGAVGTVPLTVNAPAGLTADLLALQVNATTLCRVRNDGSLFMATAGLIGEMAQIGPYLIPGNSTNGMAFVARVPTQSVLIVNGAASHTAALLDAQVAGVTQFKVMPGGAAVSVGGVGPASQSGITFQAGEAGSNLYRYSAGVLASDVTALKLTNSGVRLQVGTTTAATSPWTTSVEVGDGVVGNCSVTLRTSANTWHMYSAALATWALRNVATAADSISVSNADAVTLFKGLGVFNHVPPAAQPAAPVTLADVIAIIRGCGLSA